MGAGFHGQTLHGDVAHAAGGAAQGQVAQDRDVHAVGVHKAGHFDNAVVGQVGDAAVVDHVEVAAVHTAGLDGLNDVAAVFLTALVHGVNLRRLLEPVGKVGFKPVAALGAHAQVSAGFTVDP